MRVVTDRKGTPTSARDLAQTLWRIVSLPATHHVLHWTNAGVASWYDFAVAVREIARERGLLRHAAEIVPILSGELNTPAARPAYSVLDSFLAWKELGPARDWRIALADTLETLAASAGSEREAAQRDPSPYAK